nr:auxin-responsive protein SAUR68-like [Ipomoea batatas]
MISSKKLISMAKKWQKFVAIRRKRISFPEQNEEVDGCSTSSAVNKGHFVIYTSDQKRFAIPLFFLDSKIIIQMLEMSEEEFGLPSDGPITLPCDAVLMKYIISLLSRGVSTELQNALLVSVTSNRKRNPLPSNGNKLLPSLSQLDELLGTYHGVYVWRNDIGKRVKKVL